MKFIKGMICCVDPTNIKHQDSAGVGVVELIKRLNRRPFGGSMWLCKNLEEGSNMKQCRGQERRLKPANMAMFRWPIDVPVINSNDLKALAGAISYLDGLHSFSSSLDKLKALYEKLEFYNKFREV